ncbi:MAG: FeoB-associated Cys-rich membrane protein [Lachnospiraceae bacterium]|nr:FeoB-associated Cys-rich membrane protein [Lachnospiraceae bacterium]
MVDLIILVAIAGALTMIVRKKVTDIRAGKSGCGCSGCAGCSGCGTEKKGDSAHQG